jgi:hypothetical protein
MRKFFVSAFVLVAICAFATSSFALQKSQARFTGDEIDNWAAQVTCTVHYYNICTGWVWVWSGFADGETPGTVFDNCCGNDGALTGSFQYFPTGAPPAYGFTGSAQVNTVTGTVPHNEALVWPPVAQIPYLPAGAGWEYIAWGVSVPSRFAVSYTIADANAYGTPVAMYSDGPFGCGNCFPTNRTTNSYNFGIGGTLVPGIALFDGACYVEWLSAVSLKCPVAVEDESWGSIKNLYR